MKEDHLSDAALNDYLEDLLEPGARQEAEAHVRACARCRDEAEALRGLLGEMRALPSGIRPRRNLLPEIVHRMRRPEAVSASAGDRRRKIRGLRYPLAAAAVLLVVLTAAITAWLVEDGARGPIAVAPPAAGATSGMVAVTGDYEQAIADLGAALETRRAELDPATIRLVEENLGLIDGAIRESREALAADPGNDILRDLVVSGYERKLDLLRRATRTAEL